jgi:hypothetical protein
MSHSSISRGLQLLDFNRSTLTTRLEPMLCDKSIGRWYQAAAFDSDPLRADIHVSVDTIVQYLRFFDKD